MDEKESILIIDDDENTCISLALIFGKKSYKTETWPERRSGGSERGSGQVVKGFTLVDWLIAVTVYLF